MTTLQFATRCCLAGIFLLLPLAPLRAQPVIPPNQPADQTAIAGTTATFSVMAEGTPPPLMYQWRRYTNAMAYGDIPGATNDLLELTNAQPTNHRFGVRVSNSTGSTTSRLARLTVVFPPGITNQPEDQRVEVGESNILQVVAGGTAPLSYQWRFNGQPLNGATSSNLLFASAQLSNAGTYQVIITNLYGAATSRVATVTVVPATLLTRITNGPITTDLGQCTGCVWADFDNDGFLDLYVAQYWSPTNFFYHNNRNGTFTRITQGNFLETSGYNLGVSAADYDNDGYLDFIVTAGGRAPTPRWCVLFHNNGDATFTRASAGGITNSVGYFPAAQWADYDNDGFVDLLITQTDNNKIGANTNLLWHNTGDGSFVRVTGTPIVTDRMSGWGPHWSDYDNDGLVDLVVMSTAVGPNYVYHNNGNGSFAKVLDNVIATGPRSSDIGLSSDWGDYDNDGWQDLFLPDGNGVRNHLYHNDGGGKFSNVSTGPMLTPPAGSRGRSCGWADYDNDGFLDLLIVYFDRNVVYRNNHAGGFNEVRAIAPSSDRLPDSASFFDAAAWVDYDNDGFLDLFVTVGNLSNPRVQNLLYHNAGNSNGWLEVKCVGTIANRSAIGAKIRVKATIDGHPFWQVRELRSGGGWNLATPLVGHFGLGDATNVETLRIEWPGGTVQELHNVAPRQILTITEPSRLSAATVNGQPQFTLKGGRNRTYEFQTSTNLADWSPGSSVTITNLDGTTPIVVPLPPAGPQKFYRAVLK